MLKYKNFDIKETFEATFEETFAFPHNLTYLHLERGKAVQVTFRCHSNIGVLGKKRLACKNTRFVYAEEYQI